MALKTPKTPAFSLTALVLGAGTLGALPFISHWTNNWIYSGSAIESLLLLFGPPLQADVPSWVFVLGLNAIYAVASTSWLLHVLFASACWLLVVATSIAQYAAISSFTRGRLRRLLHRVHFHQDKIAFFNFPVLIINSEISGFVAVHGITASLFTLSIEFHSIDLSLNIGQDHEIHAHSGSVEIQLFRRIKFDEIYAAHRCPEDDKEPSVEKVVRSGAKDNKRCRPDESPIAKDNIMHDASFQHHRDDATDSELIATENTDCRNQPIPFGDEDAEARYLDSLNTLQARGIHHKMRERLRLAHGAGEYSDVELVELRALLCAELRRTGLSPSRSSSQITASKLAAMFSQPDIFKYAPSALRMLLWLASHTHPIECPSISVAGSGHWLNELLSQALFRRHTTYDERIRNLEREISMWLSVGDYCVDLANITASAQVPMRSGYDIKAEVSSTNTAISRIDTEVESSTQMASLSGADGRFIIPTCLLPNHSHLVPPEPSPEQVAEAKRIAAEAIKQKQTSELPNHKARSTTRRPSEEKDTIEIEKQPVDCDILNVTMSIRMTLPAHFHESLLSFAATLSKAAQMHGIEEQIIDPPTPPPFDKTSDPTINWREKIAKRSDFIGSAIKHPLLSARGAFHREMRKSTVMTVNGAWFAKWTNKILEQLEWLNGDVGYTFDVPVSLKPYR